MIQPHHKLNEEDKQGVIHENGMFGFVVLLLILVNAVALHGLLKSFGQDSNRIDRLWEPNEGALFYIAPSFVLISLMVVWGISPARSEMNKVFKVATIVGFIVFVIYSIFVSYILAFGSART
ncbi:hypothetical protein PBAL39_00867 [Pedobacter sp. BAL39]|uniref:hypothetical protein n=1 Tax=Pedobacter sp. BAL39 TaxID=391596 RepID=UPI0001559EAE|nr:hypothetical protein [Pedobacter sp. BAL39]EDM38122.1 hypothetical protein PBAL39_00867 [Pedobacter sp. BAL39]